ncbi:photosystem II assembly factor Ycf39 [Synechococcus sp. A18-25c]|uniref:NmrA family NAD(P)-binding protein n=1 Tax=unclassified Synechococcus TaxID=2626047 RepID=UPI001647CDE1|nr:MULTISPECIES: NAD(P)H-binding protein [unclassified Synechococcus]QNI49020.1 photosystem II assembly factor Ycf39 [Synechococcus sp. A15-60]QNJ20629.1 photosystem II assembly factor Ycf39 [Synechococcus sp. A18-25c]|tara:strand:+ start:2919 stop:3881 length:963 start_codon:yes stop_codon:yes gene_type:complete
MQVLVVGGTGTLGRQIARRALDQGHDVRCMVRTPRKASFLQEWGVELTRGDLLEPASLDYALDGVDAVIDAATSRPDDPRSIYETDWDGKLNLLRACERAGVKRLVFLSLLDADKHRDVPLMDIKYCTEKLLRESELDYTVLQGAAFMQGVISQFAIPVLESQTVWVSGSPTSIAYMNTQDMARFAVSALDHPHTIRKTFPVVGPKAWNTGEVVQLCELASGKSARVFRVPPALLDLTAGICSFFEPAVNVAERLAFAAVTGGGGSLSAPMDETYTSFEIDPEEITGLEEYIREYYDTILKRLRAMEADLDKDAKKKLPF